MRLSRRFALAAVPATIGGWVLARLGIGGSADLKIRELLATLGEPGKAERIGAACLGTVGETSARALPSEANASGLRVLVRDDFARGRTVIANGWVLSATEARLYALAALTRA